MTLLLAHIWGPVLLAIGLGIFMSRSYYVRIYQDLDKEVLAVLLFGMTYIAVGALQIQFHNVWNTLPEVIISLIGWGLLAKGIVFTVAPNIANRSGDFAADANLIPAAGAIMIALGTYLSWFAYMG